MAGNKRCDFFALFKDFSNELEEAYFRYGKKGINIVHIPQLDAIFSSLENPYCSWGFADSSMNKVSLVINDEYCGALEKLDIEKIKSFASVAPFGLGTETIVDESIRKALEISGKKIALKYYGNEILTDQLPLPYPMDFKRFLYKLHIYEAPGGKFEMHRDTPHGKDHIGTFILCLPTKFVGGDLIVRSSSGEETRLGCKVDDNGDPIAWWTFFFTDCQHCVEPVTEGTRIVLQYDVFAERETTINKVKLIDSSCIENLRSYEISSSNEIIPLKNNAYFKVDPTVTSKESPKLNEKQAEDLVNILSNVNKTGRDFAIILSHLYPVYGEIESHNLRGRDKLIYNCIMQIKDRLPAFDIKIKYLLDAQVHPDDNFSHEESIVVYDIEDYRRKDSRNDHPIDDLTLESSDESDSPSSPTTKKVKKDQNNRELLIVHHPGCDLSSIYHRDATEYIGNEGLAETTGYVACILAINFRPSEAPQSSV